VKQKQQIGVFLVLVVVAAMVWFGSYRGRPVVDALNLKDDFALSVENPQIRLDQIERARKTEYKSFGRNPFSPIQAPPRVPHPQPKPAPIGPQLPPPPPPPPPLTLPGNVKFYGFGTVPNGTSRLAFFTDGEEVYVVAEGEVLLKRFRILRIGNASVEFEEISSGRTGTAPLEEQAGGSP
jgi:hypothetical protein